MKHSPLLLLTVFLLSSAWSILCAQEHLTDLYYSGNYQEVIEASEALIASGDTAVNTFYLKALSEAQQGQPTEAIASLKNALIFHPDELNLKRMLARQLFEAGNYVEARISYTFLVQTDSTDVASWLKLAEMASFRQQYRDAEHALNQVLIIDSINLNSLMMMGDILNRHHHTGAVVCYERAYRHYPYNQKAAYALANWYIQSRNSWKSIPICEAMLKIDTTSIKFSKLLGYAYYKTGDPVNAVRYLEYANSLGDSTAFSFKFKGISHYLRVDFPSAIKSLNFALKKDTLDAEIYFFLGASLATTKKKKEAMSHLNKSLSLMQPDPSIVSRIYSEQGNILRLEMKYMEAYTTYNKAWEADSTNVMSLYYMASILDNSLQQSKKALVDYQRYIEALDRLPEKEKGNSHGISIRAIVEDRIVTLREELFFRDED